VLSGYWSHKSITYARHEGPVRIAWDGRDGNYRCAPRAADLPAARSAAYLHWVSNETVEGVAVSELLGEGGTTRVVDMSSDLLSRPMSIAPFDLVYAHAQKNLGPAGVTVVIIHRRHLDEPHDELPPILRYRTHVEHRSNYNTPPVFAIYVTMLVLRWLRETVGGLHAMGEINRRKAARIYRVLDENADVYDAHADPAARSLMNVTFRLRSSAGTAPLIARAEQAGLVGIAGHRSLGGLRVSLYNAVTEESAEALAAFLEAEAHAARRRG
jgi:phosphoserine aminotransferase